MSGIIELPNPLTRDIEKQLRATRTENVVWAVIEVTAAIVDNVPLVPVGPAANLAKCIYSQSKGTGELISNPFFIESGLGDGDGSPVTCKYLRGRTRTIAGGASASAKVGSIRWVLDPLKALSPLQVDPIGAATHGNASWTTTAHLRVFRDMASKSPRGGTVARWLELVIKVKEKKEASRHYGLTSAVIPILPVVGGAMGSITGVMSVMAALGAQLTHSKACAATAIELHWRAKREQVISGNVLGDTGGAVGPASRIVWELFARHGIRRLLGKYDIAGIVREPAGWNAILDKLLLM